MRARNRRNEPATNQPIDDAELDAELDATFGRLRSATSGIDSMAALRSLEATQSRGIRLVPALAASALLALGIVGGLSLVGDEKPTSVITGQPDLPAPAATATQEAVIAIATALPTPPAADEDFGRLEAALTEAPTPSPVPSPTPTPTPAGTPEAGTALDETERENSTLDERAATTPEPVEAADFDSTPSPSTPTQTTPTPTPIAALEGSSAALTVTATPTVATTVQTTTNVNGAATIPTPTATVAATDGFRIGGGDFVGVWELVPGPSEEPDAEIRILSGGELVAEVGCWSGRAILEIDGAKRLQLVPDSLSVSSYECANRTGVMPELFLTLGKLNFGYLSNGRFLWTSHDGPSTHTTGWAPSEDLVVPTLPGDDPITPRPTSAPEVRTVEDPSPPVVTFDTKGFAGSWRLAAGESDGAVSAEATLLLSGEGDLALEVGCKVFAARAQLNDERELELVSGTGFVDKNTCVDPLASALANGLAVQLDDATASIVDGQLVWSQPDGSTLTFTR